MKFKIIVHIFLCYFAAGEASKFSTPRIFQENDPVLKTGDNLTLSCEGAEPLTWTIVNHKKINYDKASIITTVKNADDSKFPHGSILRIQNVSYLNTGFFYCHGLKASRDDSERSANIYVYVRDETRLCLVPPEELAVILAPPHTEIIIPCLPTSPDVQVILLNENGDPVSPEYSNFDPRKGFKVVVIYSEEEVLCVFTRNNQKQTIKIFLDDSKMPEIKTARISEPSGTNMVHVGGQLVLTCSVIIPYMSFYYFKWIFNSTYLEPDNRISISSEPIISVANGKLLTSTLIVNNVTMEDDGQFIFLYTADGGHSITYITVTDAVTKFIPPRINYTASEIFINADDNLTILCEGSEPINWYIDDLYNFDDNVNVKKYEKTNFLHKAIFTITNASVYNTGSFICRPENVENENPYRTAKIYVYVQDSTSLSKYVSEVAEISLKILNMPSNIPCIPTSPDVNVSFIDSKGNKVAPETASYSSKLGFNFIPRDPGLWNYTCLYNRGNLTEGLALRFLVLDDKRYDMTSLIEAPDKASIFKGQDLQLNCSMIVYDGTILTYNKSDLFLNWSVPEFLTAEEIELEDQKSFLLANGKVIVRKLIVKNADLKAEGDYECILYDGLQNEINYVSKYISVLDTNIDAELTLRIPTRKYIVTGETLILNCSAKVDHNKKFTIYWNFNNESIKYTTHIYPTNLNIYEDISGVIGSTSLIIKNVTLEEAGTYKCVMKNHLDLLKSVEQEITIHEPEAPNIFDSNLNNSEWKIREGNNIDLHCKTTGVPVPTINWTKNDLPWVIDQNRINILEDNTRVKFLYTRKEDEGKYSCLVSNIAGNVENNILLTIFADPSRWTATQITFIVILLVTLLVLLVVLIIKIIKEKKRQEEFKIAGLNNFEQGAVDNINPDLGVDSQADLLPYDTNFEIPRDKLKLGKQLGSGFFGVVIQGEATGIFPEERKKVVAVKMVKAGADYMHIKALLSELKIMIHLGKHLNVVNLLGACTRNISKRELLVVVEYCRYGNIQDFLFKQRNNFINQINTRTDTVDISIGADILKQFAEQEYYADPLNQTFYYNIIQESSKYSNVLLQEDILKHQISPSKKGKELRPTCTLDLLCWSFQIVQGMGYLASRKVLHGDLAARNILLADNNIVKICDFGLAKNMYKNNNYKKKTDGPLPVKWMAPESITDRVFSTQSDIWSFGIVLWELFSMARTPYPEMEVDQRFYDKLLSGYRMSQPEFSTNAIYQIMMNCWKANPIERSSFSSLSDQIGTMLAENVRKYYIELNRPYANLNNMRFENENDFLGMMRQPDYNNLISVSNIYVNLNGCIENNVITNNADNPEINKKVKVNYSTLDFQPNTSKEMNNVNRLSDVNSSNYALNEIVNEPKFIADNPIYSSSSNLKI